MFCNSSISKKAVMAITGLLLIGFIAAHLLGNLLIFAGPEALNGYALKLSKLGPGLWVARIGLLTILTAHIISAIKITIENRAARPIPYECKKNIETSYAARTMMFSGFIVLAYIIYHLLHFTFKKTHPEFSHLVDGAGHHDVYSMVVLSFQSPLVSGFYILSMMLLCFHLSHGISSLFQSLGLTNEKRIPCFKKLGLILSIIIFVGYSSIPACVFLGLIKPLRGGL